MWTSDKVWLPRLGHKKLFLPYSSLPFWREADAPAAVKAPDDCNPVWYLDYSLIGDPEPETSQLSSLTETDPQKLFIIVQTTNLGVIQHIQQ